MFQNLYLATNVDRLVEYHESLSFVVIKEPSDKIKKCVDFDDGDTIMKYKCIETKAGGSSTTSNITISLFLLLTTIVATIYNPYVR